MLELQSDYRTFEGGNAMGMRFKTVVSVRGELLYKSSL